LKIEGLTLGAAGSEPPAVQSENAFVPVDQRVTGQADDADQNNQGGQ